MSVLEGLNDAQLEAAQTVNGPLLILAGAGSGKTRVLTRRIAYLIGELGVEPDRILAMTFTNKAAGEMRERVEELLHRSCRNMWIGTFHSLCARLLRAEADRVGLQTNFTIYDSTDQMALMRRVLSDEELSEKQYPPRQVRARISREKNRMMDVTSFAQRASTYYEQAVARVYRQYQARLRQNNAVDFDDLLQLSVQILRDHEDVRKKYQGQFDYLLIDEYQDTNRPQYLFAQYLAELHQNICVVGDDDQSIYAWRGADLQNILNFEADYPDAHVVKLEQNYRSTEVILDASNAVIRNNAGRKGKELWTERGGGEKIRLKKCTDESEEARWIAGVVQDLKQQGGCKYKDMAVLYRTNAQSRSIEEGLRRAGIAYQIVGDVRFYERKEVKDVLAYLKLIANPRDSVSFNRVINTPRRGIGNTSVARLDDYAMREGLPLYEALVHLDQIDTIPARAIRLMRSFYEMMEGFREELSHMPADELAARVVDETGYLSDMDKMTPEERESRKNHVQELLADIQIFAEQSDEVSLDAYLRKVSLVSDVDQWHDAVDSVTLMTLHSAKGLEFPTVFISGLEDGLFPILRPGDEEGDAQDALEEERRLFYVGITRAQDRLYLSYAMQRRRYGGFLTNNASRFLIEIPEDLIDAGFRISEIGTIPTTKRRKSPPALSLHKSAEGFVMNVGSWVYHPSWGRGQIKALTGAGQSAKLKVRFEDGATKTLVAKFANLQPG
ncbi:MAG: DNA helicase-2/ATP-dependent DNA helicase PcrA [Candidatus Latescibacterota bacterium]|jgi:DNA helicase-2/ATP-dependent DNA helicase PcrA